MLYVLIKNPTHKGSQSKFYFLWQKKKNTVYNPKEFGLILLAIFIISIEFNAYYENPTHKGPRF